MHLTENQIKALKRFKEEAEAKRQKKLAPKPKVYKPKARPVKTYAEYLKDRKPITNNLAPLMARPKVGNKSSHRSQEIEKRLTEKGLLGLNHLATPKHGYLVHTVGIKKDSQK